MNVLPNDQMDASIKNKEMNLQTVPVWVKSYIFSAAAILTITGAAKVWTTFSHEKFLAVTDPVTGMPFGRLMLAVGICELVFAGFCTFSKAWRLSLALIAWLATSFLIYRAGFGWMGWHRPCSCMGNLTDALNIPPQTADTAMKIILAYLLIGSYTSLFWLWQQKRKMVQMQVATPNV
jgi:hypothetical protein